MVEILFVKLDTKYEIHSFRAKSRLKAFTQTQIQVEIMNNGGT